MSTGPSPTRNSPRRIGVTGGIGSGKTTVCREFERLGRTVIYADPLARELMEKDRELKEELLHAFGAEAFLPDGSLNRAYLAERVFSSDKQRKRMNGIVHPFVLHAISRIIESRFRNAVEPYVLIEAALLYESGMGEMLDAVLLIDAPVDAREARIVARNGLGPEDIRRRMESQASSESLRRKADFILDNIGDIPSLRQKVAFFDRLFVAI